VTRDGIAWLLDQLSIERSIERFRHAPGIDHLDRLLTGHHDDHTLSEDEEPDSASGVVWLGGDIKLSKASR
jgi:hypothetical protein